MSSLRSELCVESMLFIIVLLSEARQHFVCTVNIILKAKRHIPVKSQEILYMGQDSFTPHIDENIQAHRETLSVKLKLCTNHFEV